MNNFFYPLVENPYSDSDIKEGIKVLKSKQLTISSKTSLFENKFSLKLKSKYSLMVNSGSSANLLALQCLINPYRKNRLFKGDEVISGIRHHITQMLRYAQRERGVGPPRSSMCVMQGYVTGPPTSSIKT